MSGLTRMHTSIPIREISRRNLKRRKIQETIPFKHTNISFHYQKTLKLVRQSQNFLYNNPSQTEGEQVHNLFHI